MHGEDAHARRRELVAHRKERRGVVVDVEGEHVVAAPAQSRGMERRLGARRLGEDDAQKRPVVVEAAAERLDSGARAGKRIERAGERVGRMVERDEEFLGHGGALSLVLARAGDEPRRQAGFRPVASAWDGKGFAYRGPCRRPMTKVGLVVVTMAGNEYVLWEREGAPTFPHGPLEDGEAPAAGARRLVQAWSGTSAPKLELTDMVAAQGSLTLVFRALLTSDPQAAPVRARRMELPAGARPLDPAYVEETLKTSLSYKLTRQ